MDLYLFMQEAVDRSFSGSMGLHLDRDSGVMVFEFSYLRSTL